MLRPDATFDFDETADDESLDAAGVLAWTTSLVGLGTVSLVSLLQIIGLLT